MSDKFLEMQSAASAEHGLRNITVAHSFLQGNMVSNLMCKIISGFSVHKWPKKGSSILYVSENVPPNSTFLLARIYVYILFYASDFMLSVLQLLLLIQIIEFMFQSCSYLPDYICLYLFKGQWWRHDRSAAQHHHFICTNWFEARRGVRREPGGAQRPGSKPAGYSYIHNMYVCLSKTYKLLPLQWYGLWFCVEVDYILIKTSIKHKVNGNKLFYKHSKHPKWFSAFNSQRYDICLEQYGQVCN